MIQKLQRTEKAAGIFSEWEDTMVWSALQGIMGDIYGNESMTAAAVISGDFCFLGGEPDRELAELLVGTPFIIAVPENEDWSTLIEAVHTGHAALATRYAIKKEPDVFCEEQLRKLAEGLPEGYILRTIERELYEACKSEAWCRDLVSQYPTYERYEQLGLGMAVLMGGAIVAGASSYSTYQGGIEIEIDTHIAHRRKGLATCCGAALILECLQRRIYPSWDAQNRWSVALAEKLGYHFSHEYLVYEIQYGGEKDDETDLETSNGCR